MKPDRTRIEEWFQGLNPATQERINQTVDIIAETKEKGGKVAVVTGSGPNVHEGVTTLLAELMRVGVVDG
nr:hypothetical protein [bacterium]